jgi:aldehyde:ferredoxin oxidoreductase
MYTLVTGRRKTLQDLLTAGRRIFTLKRMFNVINGISRRDDTLPERFLKEPLSEGGAKGQVVELEPMLDEYYSYMGWDKDGIPTIETLKELGILPIVEKYMNNK